MDGVTYELIRRRGGWGEQGERYTPPANSLERKPLEYGERITERWCAKVGTFTAFGRNKAEALKHLKRAVSYHVNGGARRG